MSSLPNFSNDQSADNKAKLESKLVSEEIKIGAMQCEM